MDRGSSITPRDLERMLSDDTIEPKPLPLALLDEITDGFSDEQIIGSGGFAVVYKGKLENKIVAVKRMSNTYKYEKEFQQEVECLMMVQHKNVIRFLGYCADTQGNVARYEGKFVMADVQQRLLCFEYLSKGSLHEYITDTSRELLWRDRFRIIKEICHGLHYIHQKNIVHLYLKPANILLDDKLVAKIADFGLSRCFHEMQSRVITGNIGGTLGYLAPEFGNGEITYKFDIYSLGVVIIEILTGEKGYHSVDKVVKNWSNLLEKSQCDVQLEQVRVCAEIGIECTNLNPTKRPDTQDIISRLDETSKDGYMETGVITSLQAGNTQNEFHQDTHTASRETSFMRLNPDMLTGTMRDLWLRYQQLNPDIKRCINYCCIFPRGLKLRKVDLVNLWIAQGFVKTSCATEDIEDVAERYIQELVLCSFLQPVKTPGTDCFTIHDVLHDILDKVTVNCFRIENASIQREEGWEGDVPQDVKHLFIQNYDAKLITEKILGLNNLLTLIINVVGEDTRVEEKVIESIFKELPELWVAAFAWSQEHDAINHVNKFSIPESICLLKNLRYFAFRTEVTCRVILPRKLNKLYHVQVLDFGEGDFAEFNFGDHTNLRHIFIWGSVNFPNIGRLTSLYTVPVFIVSNEQGYEVKQLRTLNKLRGCLEINGLENVKSKEEALEANLAAKERLTELMLKWWGYGDYNRRCIPKVEAEVLEGLCPPLGLKTLYICGYEGSMYPDWMVGNNNGGPKELQKLNFLRCNQSEPAPQLSVAFPHLQELTLNECRWVALPGNMEKLTSLKKLCICGCFNILSLPTLPQSLEFFSFFTGNAELVESCQTVGDPNWQKIEHIPEKLIQYQSPRS